MFSKVFKSKKSGKVLPSNIQQEVEQHIKDYRSESFPNGLMAVCELGAFRLENETITIELVVPFPCTTLI